MANRYWVGGTASWNGTAGTKWALTSGGAGGQAIPKSSDDVYFDGNSGSVTVTLPYLYPAYHRCNNFITTGFTGTLNHTGGNLEVYGTTFTLGSGMTFTGNDYIYFYSTGSVSITTNGITLPDSIEFAGSGGTYTLQDNFNNGTHTLAFSNGTFNANNKTVTCGAFSSNYTSTRTITMGSGLWTINSPANTSFSVNTTNLTFNKDTANIKIIGGLGVGQTFDGAGLTFNEVWFSGANTGTGYTAINGSNTFSNLKVDPKRIMKIKAGTTQTVSSIDMVGTAGNLITLTSYDSTTGTILTWELYAGGNNYAVNDEIYLYYGETGTALFIVTSESGGVITELTIGYNSSNFGTGILDTYTNGIGTGCQINILSVTQQGSFTISDTTGTNTVQYCDISYSTATGGATWNALTSAGNVDSGNNTGWVFAGTTLTCDSGSLILTGISNILSRGFKGILNVGSFILTGIDVTLRKGTGYLISMIKGSFDLVGIDTLFRKTQTFILSAGNFTLTGISSIFLYAKKLISDIGNFILSGGNIVFGGKGWRFTNKNKSITNWTTKSKNATSFTNKTKSSTNWTIKDRK